MINEETCLINSEVWAVLGRFCVILYDNFVDREKAKDVFIQMVTMVGG